MNWKCPDEIVSFWKGWLFFIIVCPRQLQPDKEAYKKKANALEIQTRNQPWYILMSDIADSRALLQRDSAISVQVTQDVITYHKRQRRVQN